MIIRMEANNKFFEIDGKIKESDVAPMVIYDRTMVPIRFICENLGMFVDYNDKTKIVTLSTRKKYFNTIEDCAYDWAMHFNAPSIGLYKEIGSIIYKNEEGYYWDDIMIGKDKEICIAPTDVRKGVAIIHSHSGGRPGDTNLMSKADKDLSNTAKRPCFMVDSGGSLYVYDGSSDNIKEKQQKKIRDGLPVDSTYVDMTQSCKNMNEYFKNGYCPLLKEFDRGYEIDYFNMMYLKNIKYKNKFGVR